MATLADVGGILAGAGAWLKHHRAPDLIIVLIFLFSGLTLSTAQLRQGVMDVKGLMLAFAVIFVMAPLAALVLSFLPMETGIAIGLFLVAIMPSTLSSGVVMTAAAGGNPGHALVTTLCANIVSVFTIPYVLSFLLRSIGESAAVVIDKGGIMLKIGTLVILPLIAGLVLRRLFTPTCRAMGPKFSIINQCLIIFIVTVAMSQTRVMLMAGGFKNILIILLVFVFHGLLLVCAWFLIRLSGRQKGNRESILFMGCQKNPSPFHYFADVPFSPIRCCTFGLCAPSHCSSHDGRVSRPAHQGGPVPSQKTPKDDPVQANLLE